MLIYHEMCIFSSQRAICNHECALLYINLHSIFSQYNPEMYIAQVYFPIMQFILDMRITKVAF